MLLSNCHLRGFGDQFKAQGLGALRKVTHDPFFILTLIVILTRVNVFAPVL